MLVGYGLYFKYIFEFMSLGCFDHLKFVDIIEKCDNYINMCTKL